MVERCQNLTLALEAGDGLRRGGLRPNDFDGHLAPGLVGTDGQVNDTHAAMADLAEDFVGTQAPALHAHFGRRRQIRQPCRLAVCGQQTRHFLGQFRVAMAGFGQVQVTGRSGQVQRRLENTPDLSKPLGVHVASSTSQAHGGLESVQKSL